MRRWVQSGVVLAVTLAASPALAQSPAQELDQHWVDVCAGAVPGTPFYNRCQEILNAGPGSGGRRSAAASGNNLETVASTARMGEEQQEERRLEFKIGRHNAFVSANSGWESRLESDREHGFEVVNQAMLGGVDYLLSPKLVTGLALAWTTYGVDFDRSVGDLRAQRTGLINTWDASLSNSLALVGHVGYLWTKHNVERNIDYVITLNAGQPNQETRQVQSLAKAVIRDWQLVAGGDLSYEARAHKVSLLPHLGLEFCETTVKPYAETDPAGLAMAYDQQKIRSMTLLSGLSASMALSREWGVLSPQIRGDLIHEFNNDQRSIVSHFAEDSTGFRLGIQTDAPDRDYVLLGGGVVAVLPGGFSVYLNFQGTLGHSQMKSQLVSTGIRARL